MIRLLVTTHAAEKMQARRISMTEVEQCVARPEVTYGRDGTEVRQLGSVAVVCTLQGDAVVVRTVLLRHQERWTDEQARARQGVAR